MKLGFFHDNPMVQDQGTYFSNTFPANVWHRYLAVFEEMIVATRVRPGFSYGISQSDALGVTMKPIRSYSRPRDLLIRLLQIGAEVRNVVREVDCVVIRLPSVIGWIAYLESRRLNRPILVELVGCPWDVYRNLGKKGLISAAIGYTMTRWIMNRVPFAVYVSSEFLQKRYPTNGISANISNVEVEPSAETLKRRLSRIRQRQRPLKLGSIGKIDAPYKGHRIVVEAIHELKQEGVFLHYEIVGPGDPADINTRAVEAHVENWVTPLGSLERQEVDAWLDQIDIYLQPSLTEGLPRAVIEAMSRGLPVVGSDIPAHRELLDADQRFKSGDSASLSHVLRGTLAKNFTDLASHNFLRSLEYSTTVLEQRRTQILQAFAAHANSEIIDR